jgi:hypothetical protein
MAPMAPTAYLTHTFRSLQQLHQQRQHHQHNTQCLLLAVLVMIFVLWCCDRQAGRPSRYLISNEWGWDFRFIPAVRDFLLEDNDCLLLHADRDVQVGLDSRTYVPICGNNRAEQEALFRIPILGATTCNNWHPLVDASSGSFCFSKAMRNNGINGWRTGCSSWIHPNGWMLHALNVLFSVTNSNCLA